MRVLVIVFCAALAACTPPAAPPAPTPPPSASAPAPDPLAVRIAAQLDQTAIAHVASVEIRGPDLELVEFRQGAQPGAPPSLAPGRIGSVTAIVTTEVSPPERTLEAWHLSARTATGQLARTLIVRLDSGDQAATYTFTRCLPKGALLSAPAQNARARQVWTIQCEGMQRS